MSDAMPALFLGHGNPMNALSANRYTEAWATLARGIPRPQAILAISAHWFVPGTGVTVAAAPARALITRSLRFMLYPF